MHGFFTMYDVYQENNHDIDPISVDVLLALSVQVIKLKKQLTKSECYMQVVH